jgi:hypothetical protein
LLSKPADDAIDRTTKLYNINSKCKILLKLFFLL